MSTGDYQGTPTALRNIRIGVAVQCLRKQDATGLYDSKVPQVGDVGVIMDLMPRIDGYTASFYRDNGAGQEFTPLFAMEKGGGWGAPGPGPVFKVLTGTKGQAINARWKALQAEMPNFTCGRGVQLGSDPEVFVVGGDGRVLPAWKFLPRKTSPKVYSSYGSGRTANLFWDGFQAEFTIGACGCLAYLADAVQSGLEGVLVAAQALDPKAKLTHACVLDIPEDIMMSAAKEHYQLGCAPSTNIYPDQPHLDVPDARMLSYRTAGCHMHFGYGKLLPSQVRERVLAMDMMYGVASVGINQGLEDTRRRGFYGRAGEHRTPQHGLEYRVPSSAVLVHPANFHLNFDLARAAGHAGASGQLKFWQATEDETREAINNLDVDLAKRIVKRNEKVMRALLCCIYSGPQAEIALQAIYGGIKELVDTGDMTKAWRLGGAWTCHSEGESCQFIRVRAA